MVIIATLSYSTSSYIWHANIMAWPLVSFSLYLVCWGYSESLPGPKNQKKTRGFTKDSWKIQIGSSGEMVHGSHDALHHFHSTSPWTSHSTRAGCSKDLVPSTSRSICPSETAMQKPSSKVLLVIQPMHRSSSFWITNIPSKEVILLPPPFAVKADGRTRGR